MNLNITTELLGFPKISVYGKHCPPDPTDPKSDIFYRAAILFLLRGKSSEQNLCVVCDAVPSPRCFFVLSLVVCLFCFVFELVCFRLVACLVRLFCFFVFGLCLLLVC